MSYYFNVPANLNSTWSACVTREGTPTSPLFYTVKGDTTEAGEMYKKKALIGERS